MLTFRHHVFHFVIWVFSRLDRNAALVFVVFAVAYIAVDFGDDGVVFWTTCFEQFRNPWQTTGNVLGLGTFTRDTRNDFTSNNFLTIFDRENRIHRHRVGHRVARVIAHWLAVFVDQDDLWFQFVAFSSRAPVDNDLLGHACRFIGFVTDCDTADKVNEFRCTGFLRDHWQCVWIPFEHFVASSHVLAISYKQFGTIADLVACTFVAILIHDRNLHAATHDHDVALGVGQCLSIFKLDLTSL